MDDNAGQVVVSVEKKRCVVQGNAPNVGARDLAVRTGRHEGC